jgi:protein-S-isoprenylcysteine O-methyltransferase Ste14
MSRLLVLGQFSMIALLLLGGGWDLPWWAWSIFGLGLAVFLWAALSLGKGNFTILPDPRIGNQLSTMGIYSYVRHPMYTAVLLCGLAVTFGAPSPLRWAALFVCAVVLVIKIRYEEGQLTARHPSYTQRMSNVARLFPGVW